MNNQKGQAALIILMVSAVLMTLGLSAARSNVVDTKIDTDQEDYRVAFDSAESGIEYYLGTGQTGLSANETKTDYKINNINKVGENLEYSQLFTTGERVNVWLVGREEDGDFDYTNKFSGSSFWVCVPNGYNQEVYWEYYSRNTGIFKVERVAKVPDGAANSCDTGWRTVLEQTVTSNATSVPFMGSLMVLNSPTRVKFKFPGSVNLPDQGKTAEVTSVAGEESSGVRVSLRVEQRYEVPEVLFQALSSLGDIQ